MAKNLNTILLAVLVAAVLGLAFYVFRQSKKEPEPGPPGPPGAPAPILPPVVIEDDTPDVVIQDPPNDNGAITLQEANYGQVLTTKPFPVGFVPGPTASPCIVARYLLDLPGMPSYTAESRLPWTYEERLVLQTFEALCADGARIQIIQQNAGFGFLAYVIFRDELPYDFDYALIYQPKLGWQLIKCLDYHGKACESVVGPYGGYGHGGHGKGHGYDKGYEKGSAYDKAHGKDRAQLAPRPQLAQRPQPPPTNFLPQNPFGFNMGGIWGARKQIPITSRKSLQ